ncbi:YggT family protein [Maridesulfovibrio hydrothermalis]|uniref:YggT family protein n=1 Tax=Maridesulfovibrio hydrothermalis AM13 = DSM 14728 TaxID=1121451 RepID=L0RDI5_9BACT|nr:YggT family protein [Maridesulfovibrio hydrothermalis]CCO24809.1 conserved protein of unknown function [Maridesulfovibrio hydrothermalis AM13 = DSM 14728]
MDIILGSLVDVISTLLSLYMWVVIISALITWVNPDPYNPIVRFLRGATEPVFAKVRQYLPFVNISGIDLSPIVVLVIIQILNNVLVRGFARLVYGM